MEDNKMEIATIEGEVFVYCDGEFRLKFEPHGNVEDRLLHATKMNKVDEETAVRAIAIIEALGYKVENPRRSRIIEAEQECGDLLHKLFE